MACRQAGLVPKHDADLSALRFVGSTGSPLPPDGFRWVYDKVAGGDVLLTSISGGTDVATAFVGGSPLLPVRAGEISGAWPGCDVHALDEDGRPVTGRTGELVVGTPMPSMPVGFVGDTDGSRFRAAYFDRYPGMWHHGDWVTIHPDGAVEVSGRSDATLNRGGVRLGTAELYTVVEELEGVADSLAVHLDDAGGSAGELILFVVPSEGLPDQASAREALERQISAECSSALRSQLSPRHVPDTIHLTRVVPRTLSGKKLEVPVKRILQGAAPEQVASADALADADALTAFAQLAADRAAQQQPAKGTQA
jgi:acetoacetyl-CoA synthetase